MTQSFLAGAQYLTKGWRMVKQPGIRRFVVVPLIINLLLLLGATSFIFVNLGHWKEQIYQDSWSWVQWIFDYFGWLLWPILILLILLSVFYFFALLANWFAAPFNGLLSERIEQKLTNNSEQADVRITDIIKDIPRAFGREWQKLIYWIPRALIILILFFIPGVNLVAPFLWVIFSAWMMAIQYIDYPMDNNKVSFKLMLMKLKTRKSLSLGFGATTLLLTSIPLVNIFIMPIAVAGATVLHCEQQLKAA